MIPLTEHFYIFFTRVNNEGTNFDNFSCVWCLNMTVCLVLYISVWYGRWCGRIWVEKEPVYIIMYYEKSFDIVLGWPCAVDTGENVKEDRYLESWVLTGMSSQTALVRPWRLLTPTGLPWGMRWYSVTWLRMTRIRREITLISGLS